MICIIIETSEGKKVECKILETIYDPTSIFPKIFVEALKGVPFGLMKSAIVSMPSIPQFVFHPEIA